MSETAETFVQDLLSVIEAGDESAAIFRFDERARSGPDPREDPDELTAAFERACDAGMARLARAMLLALPEPELDRQNAFSAVAESFDPELLGAVVDLPDEEELWRMAYKASRALDYQTEAEPGESQACGFLQALVGRARELRRADWAGARREPGGLAGRWARRARGRYEATCEELGVPLWSASAAPCALDKGRSLQSWVDMSRGDGWEGAPETMEERGWALDQPEEVLLWGPEAVEAWSAEIALHPEALAWRSADFEEMAASWGRTRAMLPWIRKEVSLCRKEEGRERAGEVARRMVEAGAERWIPFVLAWADHRGFEDGDALRFGPMLDASRVDLCNVGMVAANIDYGSFNARLARVAEEVRRRGGMDDASAQVVHARWEDLFADKTWQAFFERSSFQGDFLASRAFFEGEAIKACVRAGAPRTRPRSM